MHGNSGRGRIVRRLRSWLEDVHAASAVEFALILPVFCLLLAGVADFGGVLYTKFGLDGAVSSMANYTLLNASSVNSTSASTLAKTIAGYLGTAKNGVGTNIVTGGTVVVNNGATATITSGTATATGTAANADSYYCPTKATSGLTWGSAITSGTCSGGAPAGKFVSITATKTYSPIFSFSSYGIVKGGAITSSAVVQTAVKQ